MPPAVAVYDLALSSATAKTHPPERPPLAFDMLMATLASEGVYLYKVLYAYFYF